MDRRAALCLCLAAFAGLSLSAALPAKAEQAEIIRKLDDQDGERIASTIDKDFTKVRAGVYRMVIEGQKCLLFVNGETLQFYAGFKLRRPLPIKTINEWNMSKRFTHAYLDKAGDPVVEMDLDLEGGITPDAVKNFVKTWRSVMPIFIKHIGFKA